MLQNKIFLLSRTTTTKAQASFVIILQAVKAPAKQKATSQRNIS